MDNEKLQIKATFETEINIQMYKLVDFLNKNLKNKNVIFGLAQKDDKMIITLYEV